MSPKCSTNLQTKPTLSLENKVIMEIGSFANRSIFKYFRYKVILKAYLCKVEETDEL